MKTFVQLSGNYDIITCLNDTLVINTCGFDGGYEYEDLEKSIVQVKSIKVEDATKDRNMMFIALGVSLFVVLVAMVVFFKLEGLYAIPTVAFSEFLNIYLFNKF